MNHAEWLRSDDTSGMLDWLRSIMSEEVFDCSLRRYYLACCRRIWRLLPPDAIRLGLEAAEHHLEDTDDPSKASYWAQLAEHWCYFAEADLYAIYTYNRVCDEQELPDEAFFLQSGRHGAGSMKLPTFHLTRYARWSERQVTPSHRRPAGLVGD